MKWISSFKHPKKFNFIIRQEKLRNVTDQKDEMEFHLFVLIDNKEVYDDVQDTLEFAKDSALEEFDVPLDSWEQVE